MADKKRIIAVLLGREGSVGLPGKNVKTIMGRPSLTYPLLAATHSGVVDKIYLSTDSEEIRKIASEFNVENIFRPDYLASNDALLEDAMVHAISEIKERESEPIDYFLFILCNAVTVLPDVIAKAVKMLNENDNADSVTTVQHLDMYSVVRARKLNQEDGTLETYLPLDVLNEHVTMSCARNKSEPCYYCDHSFTLVRAATLENFEGNPPPFKWMGANIMYIEQEPGGGDIDLPWQVPIVEWWLDHHGFTETKTPYE